MSSFDSPHQIYLFALVNGKKKLAYGPSPEKALEILRSRLTETEFRQIRRKEFERIRQQDLQSHIHLLG